MAIINDMLYIIYLFSMVIITYIVLIHRLMLFSHSLLSLNNIDISHNIHFH